VVYGPWWWPYYRPVFWRPWAPRPVFVATGFFYSKPNWQQRQVQVVHRPVNVRTYPQHVAPGKWQHSAPPSTRPYQRVPESQRRPIVQQHMPAANGFSRPQPQNRPQVRQEDSREQRPQFDQHQQRGGEQRGGEQRRQFQQRGNPGGNQGAHQGRGGGRG
jgi:hypothetical protein